jgi:hypothetical protein
VDEFMRLHRQRAFEGKQCACVRVGSSNVQVQVDALMEVNAVSLPTPGLHGTCHNVVILVLDSGVKPTKEVLDALTLTCALFFPNVVSHDFHSFALVVLNAHTLSPDLSLDSDDRSLLRETGLSNGGKPCHLASILTNVNCNELKVGIYHKYRHRSTFGVRGRLGIAFLQ